MDPRVKHSLRFTIEPYSARSEGYDLTYAFMQRDLNEMRGKLEQVQSELSDLKNIVQVNSCSSKPHLIFNKKEIKEKTILNHSTCSLISF